MELLFQKKFNDLIWRILPDTHSNLFAVELRDEQSRKVVFHGLDSATGEILSEIYPTHDDWWVGIECVYNQKMILHGFEDEENPTHSGVYCYDLRNGKLLWSFPSHRMNTFSHDFVLMQSEETVTIVDWSGESVAQSAKSEVIESDRLQSPSPYSQESEYFNTVSQFISERFGQHPIELIEYLETEQLIMISYNFAESGKLTNQLKVLTIDGEIVLEEVLGTGLKGIGVNTFFLSQNQLIFTKDKTELVSYSIQ